MFSTITLSMIGFQLAARILDWNEKQGIASILVKRVCEVWSNHLSHCTNYADLIVTACIFGQIYKKQDRYKLYMYIDNPIYIFPISCQYFHGLVDNQSTNLC